MLLCIFPTLRTVAIIWIIYGAFAYSLVQVTRETLYTPVRSELRTAAKFYIDTFVFRFGDAFTALLLASNTLRVPKMVTYGYSLPFLSGVAGGARGIC